MKARTERTKTFAMWKWYLGFVSMIVTLAWLFGPSGVAVSILFGASIVAVNFFLLYRNCQAIFAGAADGERNGKVAAALGFSLRFLLLLLVVAVSIYIGTHPIGLVIGLSLIVPSILVHTWINRPATDEASAFNDEEGWETWNPSLAREEVTDEDKV